MVVYYIRVNNSKLRSRFNLFSVITNDKTPNKHVFYGDPNECRKTFEKGLLLRVKM